MGTVWHDDPLALDIVRTDIRNAMRATKPADVLHARFPYVSEQARADFITLYETGTDDRALLVQRFAETVQAYWYEQRDRSQGVLRRVWRLLK